TTSLRQPHFTAVHSPSLHAAVSSQNWSGFSGWRRYASRSGLRSASRTAAERPSRAASKILTPSSRARPSSSSSTVKVVLEVETGSGGTSQTPFPIQVWRTRSGPGQHLPRGRELFLGRHLGVEGPDVGEAD